MVRCAVNGVDDRAKFETAAHPAVLAGKQSIAPQAKAKARVRARKHGDEYLCFTGYQQHSSALDEDTCRKERYSKWHTVISSVVQKEVADCVVRDIGGEVPRE